jgi:hypothetical protein
VHRPAAGGNTGLPTREGLAAAGQGGVDRHWQLEAEQAQHAGHERRGLAQGEVEHEAQAQHQLDRQVRVDGLTARRAPSRRVPSGDGCVAGPLPSCHLAASPHQRHKGRYHALRLAPGAPPA